MRGVRNPSILWTAKVRNEDVTFKIFTETFIVNNLIKMISLLTVLFSNSLYKRRQPYKERDVERQLDRQTDVYFNIYLFDDKSRIKTFLGKCIKQRKICENLLQIKTSNPSSASSN